MRYHGRVVFFTRDIENCWQCKPIWIWYQSVTDIESHVSQNEKLLNVEPWRYSLQKLYLNATIGIDKNVDESYALVSLIDVTMTLVCHYCDAIYDKYNFLCAQYRPFWWATLNVDAIHIFSSPILHRIFAIINALNSAIWTHLLSSCNRRFESY